MPFVRHAVSLLLIWLLVGLTPARASHLVGGELTYRFLDAAGPAGRPFRYQITARIYCSKEIGSSSPDGPASIPLNIYSKASGRGLLLAVNVLRDSFAEITSPGLSGCTLQGPRVTLALYDTIFSLPAVPEGYVALFTSASRNGGVTNIRAAGATGMTLDIDLTPGTLPNASPEFTQDAFLTVCQGQASAYLNNAYDADGDRLSYSIVAPAGSPDFSTFIPTILPVVYAPGYSATQPFGSAGDVTLDASTGLATFRSPNQGYFVLAVEVREYRLVNGQELLLGTSRRDMQVAVLACGNSNNSPPAFTSPTQWNIQVEEGQVLQFPIAAVDPDGQPLTMTVSSVLLDGAGPVEATFNGLAGALTSTRAAGTVSVTSAGTVSGTFRLEARCGLARAIPYDVTVTVSDEACGSSPIAEVFRLTVVRPRLLLRVQGDSSSCTGSVTSYSAVGPWLAQYRWVAYGGQLVGSATGQTVQVRWNAPGVHTIMVTGLLPGGCLTDSVSQRVTVSSGPAVVGPTSYCPRTQPELQYIVTGPPAAYQWTITGGTLVRGQGTNEAHVTIVEGNTAVLQVADPASPSCFTRFQIASDEACLGFFNIMTPNGDGKNDVFFIENLTQHPHTSLSIFNRWGRVMYQTADYHNTYDGTDASAGLYYYVCRLADGNIYKGWFEVVK
jgi:gliding motility-associated-like protein